MLHRSMKFLKSILARFELYFFSHTLFIELFVYFGFGVYFNNDLYPPENSLRTDNRVSSKPMKVTESNGLAVQPDNKNLV